MSNPHAITNDNNGWTRKSFKLYLVGYISCLMLTFMSFGLVEYNVATYKALFGMLGFLAVTQVVVQSICFLGFNTNRDGRWNLFPFLFTLLIIFFLVGGSLWIMYNLNFLMMGPYLTAKAG